MGLFGSKGNENIGVKSLGIRSFIGEVFGRKIAALPQFAMEEKQVEFLLVDNDVLVTQGFSNYNMKHFGPQKYYELAIRVPFNWDYASSDKHETWIVELLQTIVKEAIEGNRPVSDN